MLETETELLSKPFSPTQMTLVFSLIFTPGRPKVSHEGVGSLLQFSGGGGFEFSLEGVKFLVNSSILFLTEFNLSSLECFGFCSPMRFAVVSLLSVVFIDD